MQSHPYRVAAIINDCTDDNARMRQSMRFSLGLGGIPVTYLGVPNFSFIAASGNLIDALGTVGKTPAIIMVNVAPRHGGGKRFKNGTPFGYFFYRGSLIVTTVSDETLSLVKKFKLVDTVRVLDPDTSLPELAACNIISDKHVDWVRCTQFRSCDFAPRIAEYVAENPGKDLPGEDFPISEINDTKESVWWIDNFGNMKLTLTPDDIDFKPGSTIKTQWGDIACYDRLSDVPNNEAGCIIGSSGVAHHRFLEIVIQGASAEKKLNAKIGDEILPA